MMEERREFERYQVPIPCTLYWHGHIIKGQISNLSLGGALITRLSAIPPEHAFVVLTFQAEEGQVQLRGELTQPWVSQRRDSVCSEPGPHGSVMDTGVLDRIAIIGSEAYLKNFGLRFSA